MRNNFISLLCLFASLTVANAQSVQQVNVGDNQNFGITYTLPKTEITVKAKATVTKTVAGIYAPYAEKYLGLTDVITTDQTVCELKTITMQSAAIPDASRTYHVTFPEKGALPQFYLTDEGMLLSINRAPELPAAEPEETEEPEAEKKLTLKASDVMNEDILKAGSKAKQAELTAREIFSIRESRRNLLKGDVDNMPADGASFQLVLDNLDAQEQALMSLFVGVSTVTNVEREFKYVPAENTKNEVLFRFSSYMGFVDKDDLLGEPYYISVNVIEDNRMDPAPVDPKKKAVPQGIAYTVPGKAGVKLSFEGKTIASTDLQMGQFGHVEQLPATQFTDKKKLTTASFNPQTGSIKIYE